MSVVQAIQDGGDEGLQDLLLSNAAQEAEGHTPQVLIRMLQIVPQMLAHKDLHFTDGVR